MSEHGAMSVDCSRCVTRFECGSIPDAGLFGCYDYCASKCDKKSCDFTCPHNPKLFSDRWIEVKGRKPVKLTSPVAGVEWPHYLPTIFGPYQRQKAAAAECVALPLAKLFNYQVKDSIRPVATDPLELRKLFQIRSDSRIFATGVDEDHRIERLWRYHRQAPLAKWLKDMGVEVATAPNYSYFAYAPRDHYLWNRKRMLLFVEEMGKGGFPVIPHIYAETLFDWDWWAKFYREHPDLNSFAIELQTSDALKDRLPSFVAGVKQFTAGVGRPLTPVVIGGRRAISELAPLFPNLVVTDASAYMKTIKRYIGTLDRQTRVRWQSLKSTGSIETLFDHNVRVVGDAISGQFAEAHAQTAKTQTAAA